MRILFILLLTINTAWAAPSVLLYNQTRDEMIINQDSAITRPIASLTKLMTAMVAIDAGTDLNREAVIDRSVGTRLQQRSHTRRDIFNALLVRSDNGAAETLARDYPGGRKEFVKAMNRKALQLEMFHTVFVDPSGLSRGNQATAYDVATMLRAADGYELIRFISTQKQIEIDMKRGKVVRSILLNNTNQPLLFEFDTVKVSKTGFTNPAGWCVGLVVEHHRQKYLLVVLGEKNKATRQAAVEKVMYNHILDREN
jgi:D-alanyl-D-alanine endopeptidase (penicillin-binding protein 7)